MLDRFHEGGGSAEDIPLIGELSQNMLGRTFCPLGDAAALPTISIVKKWRNEFEDHLNGKCAYKTRGQAELLNGSVRSCNVAPAKLMAENKNKSPLRSTDSQVTTGARHAGDRSGQGARASKFRRSAITRAFRCRPPAACAWSKWKRCRSCRRHARWSRPTAWW